MTIAVRITNEVRTVANGGCGACDCPCHTDVPDPGPHIASCKFADPDYVPPDFESRVECGIMCMPGEGHHPSCRYGRS